MLARGVPTAPFVLARTMADLRSVTLPYPLFVKPAFEGSGKGVNVRSLCRNRKELLTQVDYLLSTYHEPVVVETYLPGAEFTVAIMGNGADARCLPIVGMNFDDLPAGAPPIYGYEAKWIWDTLDRPLEIYQCPAAHPGIAGRRGSGAPPWPVTTRWSAGTGAGWTSAATPTVPPMVVELNPLPGILPDPRDNSCFPKAARVAGMNYDDLIQAVANLAWQRIHGRPLLARVA